MLPVAQHIHAWRVEIHSDGDGFAVYRFFQYSFFFSPVSRANSMQVHVTVLRECHIFFDF